MSRTPRVTVDYSDQTRIFDPASFNATVTVIGCGGIGSEVIWMLAKMGVKKFQLFDDDFVEPRNLASQAYRPPSLYKPKAEASEAEILSHSPEAEVTVHRRLFTADDELDSAVVIGAVDSMAARKLIWQQLKDNPAIQLYLDGRIGGEHLSLFAVDPLQGEWYESQWLFDDDSAMPLPCGERAIIYPATILGSLMCRHLAHWHGGEELPEVVDFSTGDLFLQKIRSK